MKKKGKLIVVSGPSGVGKKTILSSILQDKSLNLTCSISMTTRTPRPGEVNGTDYFFVTKDQFETAIKNNELLEYAIFVNNYYGTPKKYVETKLCEGTNVILEIEVQGAQQIMKSSPLAETIFILPPSINSLRMRLENRKKQLKMPPQFTIDEKNRLKVAKTEIDLKSKFKYSVVNDNLETCIANLKLILKEICVAK